MQTLPADYSHQQLVDMLVSDYADYFLSDYEDDDALYSSSDDYRSYLITLTHSQLVDEYQSQN